jgi:endonuclease/exonuclease/phosphatase family metal-dependent hydrolase
VSNTSARWFSVSARVQQVSGDSDWWLTTVYGPSRDCDKPTFLEELHALRQVRLGPWVICGDFNMIYRAQDKNNDHLHRGRMGQFRHFIDEATVKEVHLEGRLFTWSNERSHLTLEKIDRVFISTKWEALFPGHELISLSSLCSDHTQLLLKTKSAIIGKKRFTF